MNIILVFVEFFQILETTSERLISVLIKKKLKPDKSINATPDYFF